METGTYGSLRRRLYSDRYGRGTTLMCVPLEEVSPLPSRETFQRDLSCSSLHERHLRRLDSVNRRYFYYMSFLCGLCGGSPYKSFYHDPSLLRSRPSFCSASLSSVEGTGRELSCMTGETSDVVVLGRLLLHI